MMHQSVAIVSACVVSLCGAMSCATQSKSPPSGSALYATNCASCHGRYADGSGPVSADMTIPDLRYLTADNHGVFPGAEIAAIIDGRSTVKAHGARQMPVWGDVFASMEGADTSARAHANAKIQALVTYLESIQQNR
jgi:mono/diheme cytochrome c family protein